MSVRTLTAACLAAALLLAGCGGDPAGGPAATSGPVLLRDASLRPGDPMPSATGAALLTVSTGGTAVPFDRGALDRLSQVEVRTYEPWVKQDLVFRGVWLSDVLAVAGATPTSWVRVVALDDYAVTFTVAEVTAAGDLLLATGDGTGTAIPVDEGGPTRIVFPPDSTVGADPDRWIWSLRTVDVR